MPKIESLKVGQELYSVESHQMGNTTVRSKSISRYKITEIDVERNVVKASYNGHPPRRIFNLSTLRVKRPILIRGPIGNYRLATRKDLTPPAEAAKGEK